MKKYNGKFKKNLKYILYKDLIFELREKRYTYEKIVEYLKEQGINESLKSVRRICKIVYAEKGKEEPRGSNNNIIKIDKNELYELKEQGLAYREIVNHYKKKGIQVSITTLCKNCKKIYDEKNEKVNVKKCESLDRELVFSLREKLFTYKEIAQYIKENYGIDVPVSTVYATCKKIYKEKGKDPGKLKKFIYKDMVIDQVEKGLSFRQIRQNIISMGDTISYETIRKIWKQAKNEKQMESLDLSNVNKDRVSNIMLRLKETRKAKTDQLKKLAEIYNIDLKVERPEELSR